MRGRNQECVAWTPPIYIYIIFWVGKYGHVDLFVEGAGKILVWISVFVRVLQDGLWQVYKCGKIQHCPGGLPGQCNGGLVGTPCAECPAGVGFMGLSIHSNEKKKQPNQK